VNTAIERLGRCAPGTGERLLITAALSCGERADEAWSAWRAERALDDAGWRTHALLPMLLDSVSVDALGSDRQVVKHLRTQNWVATQLRLARLGAVLRTSGVPADRVMVFKGAALVQTTYPPGARTMADVDLAIRPEHFRPTIDALLGSGWHLRETTGDDDWVRALTAVDSDGFEVDLHRWVLYPRYTRRSEKGIWHRGRIVEFGTGSALVPDTADAIVIAVLHGLTPTDAGAVRWPVDVALLARSAGDGVWDDVADIALELGVGPLVAAGLSLLSEEFGVDLPAGVIGRLGSHSLDRSLRAEWWLRRHGISRGSRARWYADGCRAVGIRATPWGYAAARWRKLLAGQGPKDVVRLRLRRAHNYWRYRRDHRTRW
jgi:hypothetical protein